MMVSVSEALAGGLGMRMDSAATMLASARSHDLCMRTSSRTTTYLQEGVKRAADTDNPLAHPT